MLTGKITEYSITILKKLDKNIMCENHFPDIYEELSILMSSESLLVSTSLLAFAVLMPFDKSGVWREGRNTTFVEETRLETLHSSRGSWGRQRLGESLHQDVVSPEFCDGT